MDIGVSLACFYPEHPEAALDHLPKIGANLSELFINTISEMTPEYIENFAEKAQQQGVQIYSLHPFTSAIENYLFFSPYDRRMADAADFYERYFIAAARLGARVVQMHGDKGSCLHDIDRFAAGIEEISRRAARHGIILAQENVYMNSVNHPEFIYQLRRKLGEGAVKFTLDLKQAYKGGQDIFAVCEAMGRDIVNFHINDFDKEHICMLPGEGTVEYPKLFEKLKAQGYTGPAIIEVYSDNYSSLDQLEKSFRFLTNFADCK